MPARSGRSILHLPVLVVVRGIIQQSVRLPARTTMQRSYMPCTNTTAFCPKSHLPSVTAWGVILWLLDSRRVWVSLHGAGHLGFGLALTPEQRGPKRRGRKENKCPSSRGWRSRHKPHLHPPDEATGVWRTGTTSGAVARRFSARPARVSDLRGCLRLAGVPGSGSDEESPIACLQHHTTRQVFPTSSPLRQTSNVQRDHRRHPCATVKLG